MKPPDRARVEQGAVQGMNGRLPADVPRFETARARSGTRVTKRASSPGQRVVNGRGNPDRNEQGVRERGDERRTAATRTSKTKDIAGPDPGRVRDWKDVVATSGHPELSDARDGMSEHGEVSADRRPSRRDAWTRICVRTL